MSGMNAISGHTLNGVAHIRQSISDILLTPIGSRVMRRDYGSLVLDLIDHPVNGITVLQLYASIAMALAQWEPRIELTSIAQTTDINYPGQLTITLDFIRFDTSTPEAARLDISLPTGTNS